MVFDKVQSWPIFLAQALELEIGQASTSHQHCHNSPDCGILDNKPH